MLNLDIVFNIGTTCQYLKRQRWLQAPVKGEMYISGNLATLQNLLSEMNINTGMKTEITSLQNRLEEYEEEHSISEEDAETLYDLCNRLETVLLRIFREKKVFEIQSPGGLSVSELKKITEKQPNEFFSEWIWDQFSDVEKSDLSDAAKCLLVGAATPSVMVSLRVAEASVRTYYFEKTREDPSNKTWRQITRELKQRCSELAIKDSSIGYLDYIGEAKRNVAQHPNLLYSLSEAVMIFMQVANFMEDIYAEIS